MTKWQLQEAKARFSEVVDSATTKGPQIITRRGVKTAVVLSYSEWEKTETQKTSTPGRPLAALTPEERKQSDALLALLRSGPKFEIPPRRRLQMRKPVEF